MSETMKKKPRRSTVNGGAEKHGADLHAHRPSPEAVESMIQEIRDMKRDDVRKGLRDAGFDPDQLVKRIKAKMDENLRSLRRGHHPEETLIPNAAGRGVRIAAGARSTFEWSSTRCVADGLRGAASRAGGVVALSKEFEHLGVEVDALRIQCAADPDAVWPLVETIRETAIVVAAFPELWPTLATAHANLASRMAPVHQCMLVYNVHELREGKVIPAKFVARISDGLAHAGLSDEAHALHLRMSGGERKQWETPHTVDPVSLFSTPVADPLSCFFVMHSFGEVLRDEEAALPVIEELIESLRNDSASHFFVVGALSRYRNRHPNRVASRMAAAAETASDRGRYALFVAAIRGYEQSFRGRRQKVVPRFDLTSAPQFVPGDPHDLDLFGQLVCASGAARELHAQMHWANRRLEMWLSR